MNVVLTKEDLQSAPREVLAWLHLGLGCDFVVETPDPDSVIKAVEASAERQEEEPQPDEEEIKEEPQPADENDLPGLDEVMEAAVNLVKSKGEDCLAGILKDMGVSRVRDCPADHLAELLTRIATEMD